jgi:tetratricopeptide (TPR) repeat protein
MDEIRKGRDAYVAEGTGPKIQSDEIVAWVHYAEGKQQGALEHMRAAADLQDKVGQGEVDIPAREMLGDMLLEFGEPQEALAEYQVALKFSPNRLNCLYNAGRAADAAGDTEKARQFYQSLLKVTNNGQNSGRPELAQAKRYLKSSEAPSPPASK